MLQKNRTFTGRSKGVSVGTTHRSISFYNQWFCMCVYFCSQQQRVVKSLIAIIEEICLVCHLQVCLDNLYELGGLFFRNQWNELLDVSIQIILHCNFLTMNGRISLKYSHDIMNWNKIYILIALVEYMSGNMNASN